jgi:ribosomal protein S18 acetylase RimI-like enzyme
MRPLRPPPAARSRLLRVEIADELSDELVEAIRRLVPQLSSSAPVPTREDLAAIVASPATTLVVATDDDRIVGTLTLALFRIPSGTRAWIEDVVVDEAARRLGTGEALTREAIRLAGEAGARTVDLTSRPEREAANRMYEKLGFRRRDTNVYRHEIS